MSKKFNCSMQKKIESLAKKSETKKSESGDALKKVVDAASAALNNYDSDNVDVIKDEETGELVVTFHSSKTSRPITKTGVYADEVDLRQLEKELDKLTVGYVFESKKSEGIEDQPEDVQKMVKELAEETDNNVEDAVVEDYAPGNGLCVTFGDEEYYCYADYSEAENASNEGVKGLLEEEGVSFIRFENLGGIEQFLDVDWFKDAQREDAEFYVSDIKESEPERYKEEFGDIDEEDAVEKCLADWGDDYIQWFKDNFGEKELDTVIKENNLVDLDALAEAITEADGPANELASYDGEEIELPCGYYCYRHN